jgi:hypothetical protein
MSLGCPWDVLGMSLVRSNVSAHCGECVLGGTVLGGGE